MTPSPAAFLEELSQAGASAPGGYRTLLAEISGLPPVSPERSELVTAAIDVWRRPGVAGRC